MHIHVYIKGMEEIKTTVERKRICLSQGLKNAILHGRNQYLY